MMVGGREMRTCVVVVRVRVTAFGSIKPSERSPQPQPPNATTQPQELMHHYLVQDPRFPLDPGEAMLGACRRMDAEVLEICARESLYCGTTAIMALIRCVRGISLLIVCVCIGVDVVRSG